MYVCMYVCIYIYIYIYIYITGRLGVGRRVHHRLHEPGIVLGDLFVRRSFFSFYYFLII